LATKTVRANGAFLAGRLALSGLVLAVGTDGLDATVARVLGVAVLAHAQLFLVGVASGSADVLETVGAVVLHRTGQTLVLVGSRLMETGWTLYLDTARADVSSLADGAVRLTNGVGVFSFDTLADITVGALRSNNTRQAA
jgi:hypothetical protein